MSDKLGRDNLHVASQHDKLNIVFFEKSQLGRLLLGFVFFGDGKIFIIDTETFGGNLHVGVIAHDKGYFDLPFASRVTSQQVIEAMRHFRDENGHARHPVTEIQAEIDVILLGTELVEVVIDFVFGNDKLAQIPFYAHEEDAILAIDILVEVENISAIDIDKIGNDGHDSRLVGTVHQQYGIFTRFRYVFCHFSYTINIFRRQR